MYQHEELPQSSRASEHGGRFPTKETKTTGDSDHAQEDNNALTGDPPWLHH